MAAQEDWDVSPRITFRLSEDLRKAVATYCRKHGLKSPSELARLALAEKIGHGGLAEMRTPGRPKGTA